MFSSLGQDQRHSRTLGTTNSKPSDEEIRIFVYSCVNQPWQLVLYRISAKAAACLSKPKGATCTVLPAKVFSNTWLWRLRLPNTSWHHFCLGIQLPSRTKKFACFWRARSVNDHLHQKSTHQNALAQSTVRCQYLTNTEGEQQQKECHYQSGGDGLVGRGLALICISSQPSAISKMVDRLAKQHPCAWKSQFVQKKTHEKCNKYRTAVLRSWTVKKPWTTANVDGSPTWHPRHAKCTSRVTWTTWTGSRQVSLWRTYQGPSRHASKPDIGSLAPALTRFLGQSAAQHSKAETAWCISMETACFSSPVTAQPCTVKIRKPFLWLEENQNSCDRGTWIL